MSHNRYFIFNDVHGHKLTFLTCTAHQYYEILFAGFTFTILKTATLFEDPRKWKDEINK